MKEGFSLWTHVRECPADGWATLIFLAAVLHTFLVPIIRQRAEKMQHSFCGRLLHMLSEVELVFILWALPLIGMLIAHNGLQATTSHLTSINYTEPLFVVVILAIASTRPILCLVETLLSTLATRLGGGLRAWWFAIVAFTPLLGSFITEPAAMTLAAIMLQKRFFVHRPPLWLSYATLGLLFVNVSIGGALTHFAAPPILMVAGRWNWDITFMMRHFGWVVILAVVLSSLLYLAIFYKHYPQKNTLPATGETRPSVPVWLSISHVLFLAWTVINLHHKAYFLSGFVAFCVLVHLSRSHQDSFSLKMPLFVGLFLGGLVIHGSLQQWWLAPTLGSCGVMGLFLGATFLTSFNDNAAITYLASMVPALSGQLHLQKAVVAGAITGGGLTVIANAPNPAGQAILAPHFGNSISPTKLLIGATPPTLVVIILFLVDIYCF